MRCLVEVAVVEMLESGRFDFEKIRLGNFAFVREAPRQRVRPQ